MYLTLIISRRLPLKFRHDDPPPRPEVLLRPKERVAMIRELVETTLSRQKDLDHQWEDQVDVSYFLLHSQLLRILIFHIHPESISGVPCSLRVEALQIYSSSGCSFMAIVQFGHDR